MATYLSISLQNGLRTGPCLVGINVVGKRLGWENIHGSVNENAPFSFTYRLLTLLRLNEVE